MAITTFFASKIGLLFKIVDLYLGYAYCMVETAKGKRPERAYARACFRVTGQIRLVSVRASEIADRGVRYKPLGSRSLVTRNHFGRKNI